jgi:hypothetical protein
MSQLYIRPALNDHEVVAELLAPSPVPTIRRLRPPIARLVLDAPIAPQRPAFARAAADAGIPLLVDPLTPLLVTDVDPAHRWAKLPFASAAPIDVEDLDVDELVEGVVQFQLQMGASRVVAPYLFAEDPADPAFETSIRLLEQTCTYLQDEGLQIPVTAVFCAQLQAFARQRSLAAGVGRFSRAAADLDVETLALCMSPLGAPTDSYAKLAGMMRVATTALRSGVDVIAWRQGVYGPALAAVGLDGYETGIGLSEQTNISRYNASRRPGRKKAAGGVSAGLFIETLNRSVPTKAGDCLLGDVAMRAKILCEDDTCCPDVTAMIDHRRHHAVRSRARFLAELNQQPHPQWRLSHIARHCDTAVTVARQANKVLEQGGFKPTIGVKNYQALARVTRELAHAAVDDRLA